MPTLKSYTAWVFTIRREYGIFIYYILHCVYNLVNMDKCIGGMGMIFDEYVSRLFTVICKKDKFYIDADDWKDDGENITFYRKGKKVSRIKSRKVVEIC